MVDLQSLLRARANYEHAFKSRGLDIDEIEERFNDRDLQFSCHVFVANSGSRRIQISLTEDDVPCAFFKVTGVDHEIELLQIIVCQDDLMVEQCSELFSAWLLDESRSAVMCALAKEFPRASPEIKGDGGN